MLFRILFYILTVNIFLYSTSIYLGLDRPIINTDYIIIFLFFILFKCHKIAKISITILLFFLGALDATLFATQLFPFVNISDLFYLSTFVFTGPILYQKLFYILVFYLLLITLVSSKCFFIKYKKYPNLNFTLLFIVIISLLNTESIRSQTFFFLKNHNKNYHNVLESNTLLVKNKYNSVSKDIFSNIDQASNKILLIVNESWGQTNDPMIQKAILQPIYEKKDLYEFIQYGSFHFFGATVSGELRELCQKNAMVLDITQVKDYEFKNCLPDLLVKQGYKTFSVHAAQGKLYDRYRWYPLAGFERSFFKEDFNDYRQCKAFSGKCDYDLIEPIIDILNHHDKVLLYWLTLNTHAPYTDHLFIDGFNCEQFSIDEKSEACLNFKHQYQFFYRLAQFINDHRMHGVEVLIAGDHSPPIIDIKNNFSVYKGLDVGWVRFKIK